MITADETMFPQNVVTMLVARLALIDDDVLVYPRPLKPTDPVQAIGVYATEWNPDEESLEMRGMGNMEPSLNRYVIRVQGYIKDMDQERGLNVHSVMSRTIRSILYNDAPLRQALASLHSSLDGKTEAARRWGVRRQRFISNELDSSWLYLSTLEFWLETETM